ncbi:MAG: UDP-N-acetylmuramoyl-L-alanine--D-glutamate ligase [Patescibacteria group bacterium]
MKIKNLQNKKICILGYGIENQALVKFLIKKKIKADITICDAREDTRCSIGHRVSWRLGKNYDKNLSQFHIIFRIAGYPLFSPEIKKAIKAGVEISSPTKLFFSLCPSKNIIGVTGTKGKGTTATLIYKILKQHVGTHRGAFPQNVFIGGNIGIPMFSFLDKIKKNDWVILELSSFQLEDVAVSPKIAVITNFSREHLKSADPNNPNYHKTMTDYWKAKSNIFKHQVKSDYLIINDKLKVKKINIESSIKYFTKSELPSKLVGDYNKENIAAAVEVAKLAGVKMDTIKKVVSNFKNLENRLEYVKTIKEVKYYNNSFATTPDATIADLKSFTEPIILLAGGADKGADFKKLAKHIYKKAKFVILFKGKSSPRIKKKLLKIKYQKNKIKIVSSMKEAVKIACQNSVPGDVVLLSTACASFGLFKNYKHRGMLFKDEVQRLK